MPDLLLLDDDEVYLDALRRNIALRIPRFEVVETIPNPAPGNIAEGDFIRFLKDHPEYTPDNPLYILLDIHFGNTSRDSTLGLKIAQYLYDTEYAASIRIIAVTGKDDQLLFNDLFAAGVNNIVRKENVLRNLNAALYNAENNRPFADDFTFTYSSSRSSEEDETLRNQIARHVAMGYSNRYLHNAGGFGSAVSVQKMHFRNAHIHEISEERIPNFRHPTTPEEWNDVWFLLHHLKNQDREVVNYVEAICGLKINFPT